MRLGIVGYGNMGSAFAKALKLLCEVVVYDVREEKRQKALAEGFGVAKDLDFLLEASDWILLAVKPKDAPAVLESLRGKLSSKVLVSMVAGLSLAKITELAGSSKVIRIMPNINALVGSATIAYSFALGIGEVEKEEFLKVFSCCGSLYEVGEEMMDAFTALAGSGPAFVFKFLHGLALAGVKEGFSYETALSIVVDTVMGSCKLLKEMGKNPEEWVTRVASPGGTTIEGIKLLEEKGFVGILMECVERTSQKAKKLL